MKYFSIQTVVSAYHSLNGHTKNKFWGVLGILQVIDGGIEPGKTYNFNSALVSSFLEEIFCLSDEKKTYQSKNMWNVKFSREWLSKVTEQMLSETPNLYDVIVWAFRNQSFSEIPGKNDLLDLFVNKFHLELQQIEQLFDLKYHEALYKYSELLYDEKDLFRELSQEIDNTTKYYNITAENSFVAAHAGEVSRGPFFQTLYSGQGILECLMLTTFDIDYYYPIASKCCLDSCHLFNNDSFYRNFITAIHTKPFILLAGISGTGKSRIVRELARSCDTIDENPWEVQTPSNFCMLPVKPNWHDSTDLLGYVTRISQKTEFIPTEFLHFIIKAWTYPEVPFFLCLDEMNLAPVEQYFAEYLSCIESRKLRDGKIVTDPIFPVVSEDWYINFINSFAGIENMETFKKEGISIPQNFIVMGTVNMDETTFTFSRKVLDRAMTIEMNDVDLSKGLESNSLQFTVDASQLIGNTVEGKDVYSEHTEDCKVILQYLETVNNALKYTPFQIAYRTRNEFLLYVIENLKYQGEQSRQYCMARALDEITSMKILSRIEGDDSKLRMPGGHSLLVHLQKVINEALLHILDGQALDAEKGEVLNICHEKLKEMERKLQNGYCSFWT